MRAQSPAADLGDTLNLATWPNYHSQETLDAFTAKTGVAINLSVYGSTEEMEAKIRAGNSGIDVVVPLRYQQGDQELSFISITAVFGTPLDVTVSELAIESFYPADASTAAALRV